MTVNVGTSSPAAPIKNITNRPQIEFFSYLLKQHPIFPAGHSPAYSNVAFTILSFAVQNITGQDFSSTMQESIFDPLGMIHSSYNTAPSSGGVIAGDLIEGGWLLKGGNDDPAGSLYLSTGDMVIAGTAILQSTLLSPAQTRRWLKPLIQTGYRCNAVGAPWEITYLESPNNRMTEYYTKQGDAISYHTAIVLSPEHEVGWVVLTAGNASTSTAPSIRKALMNAFTDIFMPAIEAQALVEASINFNGTYTDADTNSSIAIAAGYNGHVAFSILGLTSRSVALVGTGAASSAVAALLDIGPTVRLFPTTLKTVRKKSDDSGTYESRLGFRMVSIAEDVPGELTDPCIDTWADLGGIIYGQRSVDDVVFHLDEDGRAVAVEIRMLRLKLTRQL